MADTVSTQLAQLSTSIQQIQTTALEVRSDTKLSVTQQYDMLSRLGALEAGQKLFHDSMDRLIHTIYDGNGQPSVLQRLTAVEGLSDTTRDDANELTKHLNTTLTATVLSRGQMMAGVIGMVVTALLSLGAILAQLGIVKSAIVEVPQEKGHVNPAKP